MQSAFEVPMSLAVSESGDHSSTLASVSWICGVIYTIMFSSGLAFQCYVNNSNKSTRGYSTDFALIAFAGFFFLLYNQTVGMMDPTTDAGRVHVMDMVFAVSAFIFSSISLTQTFIFPSDPPLRSTVLVVYIVFIGFTLAAIVECYGGIPFSHYSGFSLIYLAAICKAMSSLTKYLYQIRANYVNKGTKGYSMASMWTDWIGSLFCFAQLQTDSMLRGEASFLRDPQLNVAKTLIGAFSFLCVGAMLLQKYLLYPDEEKTVLPSYAGEFRDDDSFEFSDKKYANREPFLGTSFETADTKYTNRVRCNSFETTDTKYSNNSEALLWTTFETQDKWERAR